MRSIALESCADSILVRQIVAGEPKPRALLTWGGDCEWRKETFRCAPVTRLCYFPQYVTGSTGPASSAEGKAGGSIALPMCSVRTPMIMVVREGLEPSTPRRTMIGSSFRSRVPFRLRFFAPFLGILFMHLFHFLR